MIKKIVNSVKLYKLKNLYKNRACYLIGNGPSVKSEDLINISCSNGIVFTFNRFYLAYNQFDLENFQCHFTLSIDPQMIEDFGRDIIDNSLQSKVLLGSNKALNFTGDYLQFNTIFTKKFHFSKYPYLVTSTGHSVLVAAIQLSYFMGMKNIYLYGVDHNFNFNKINNSNMVEGDTNHFIKNYRSNKPWFPPVKDKIEASLHNCDMFLRKKGGALINCSRKTKITLLQKKDLDRVLQTSTNILTNVK